VSKDWWDPKRDEPLAQYQPAPQSVPPAQARPPETPQQPPDWMRTYGPPPPYGQTIPEGPPSYSVQTPVTPPPQKRSRTLMGVVGGVAAVIGVVAVKVGIGFVAAGVVSGAISSVFGGPFSRLPSDQRQQYESRMKSAVGDRLDGLSDSEASKKVQDWIADGLLRLDDARLVHRMDLEISALNRADVAVCATFSRQALGGLEVSADTSQTLINALDTAALGDWIGINVEALEAELHSSPPQVRISEQAAGSAMVALFRRLPDTTQTAISRIAAGEALADAAACGAVRAVYVSVLGLNPTVKNLVSRYDAQAGAG
jgi:hypothetical protein